jgi:hypothetical protein
MFVTLLHFVDEIRGKKVEEIIGKKLLELFPASDTQIAVMTAFRDVVVTGQEKDLGDTPYTDDIIKRVRTSRLYCRLYLEI